MDWRDRIVIDPAILVGKPVIKGTRIAVEFVIDLLAQGWGEQEILRNYPGLTHEDILACLKYAGESRSDWAGHFSVVEKNRIRMRVL